MPSGGLKMYDNNLSAKAQPRVPAGGAYSAPPTLAGGEGSYCPLPGTSPPPLLAFGSCGCGPWCLTLPQFLLSQFRFSIKKICRKGGLCHRSSCASMRAGAEMEKDAVWSVLLPRAGSGATQVRTARLEHSIRVQRIRSPYQRTTDAGTLRVTKIRKRYMNKC